MTKNTKDKIDKEPTKRDILATYLAEMPKSCEGKVTIGFGDELDLNPGFVEAPIPALASLMARDCESTGGFPRGRYSVIAGPEKSSKSTLCLMTVAYDMAQDKEAIWAWVNSEFSLDELYAKRLGIDFSRLLIVQEGTMEEILQKIIDLNKLHILKGVVIDSVGALTPRAEIEDSAGREKTLEAENMLNLQRKLGQFYRMSNPFVSKARCAVIQIGHVYQDPSNQGAYVVKGGNALKHWGHIRLMMSRVRDKSTQTEIIMADGRKETLETGHDVVIRLDKTRQNQNEGRMIVVPYRIGVGLDVKTSVVNMAINLGIIETKGSWYLFEESKAQGTKGIEEMFSDEPLYHKLLKHVQERTVRS